jgi:oleate hydratase
MHSTDSLEDAHPPVHGCINHHENITVPIAQFLESRGVDFQFRTKVTDIVLDHRNGFHMVSAIQCLKDSEQETTVKLRSNDIAIISLGSIMSGLATGSNTAAPSLESLNIENEFDENWLLWLELCTKHPKFGNAYNFCTRTLESRLETFTVTLRSAEFFSRLTALTGGPLGSMSLLTLKDSSWLLSIRVPQQPLFPGQPPEVQVFWGYAMRADKTGDFIKKPMFACAGREIMAELLHHLKFDPEMINDSVTVPCVVPRMTAPLLPRLTSDKPQIIPDETMNLALIGNFVYIPDEMVATTDYGVKGAKMAVRRLIGSHRN